MDDDLIVGQIAATIADEGAIELDSPAAQEIGFTSDKFDGYLWRNGDAVVISFIVSLQPGNFRELVQRIHEFGFTVEVPTPLGRMEEIVRKNGYKQSWVPFGEGPMADELVEVWRLEPPKT